MSGSGDPPTTEDNGKVQMGLIVCPDSYLPGFVPGPPELAPDTPLDYLPKPAYHVMRAFERFSETPQLVSVKAFGEVDALAGRSDDGGTVGLLIMNWGEAKDLPVALNALPWEGEFNWRQYMWTLGEKSAVFTLDKVAQGRGNGKGFREKITIAAKSVCLLQFEIVR